jgi:hypothetical protein
MRAVWRASKLLRFEKEVTSSIYSLSKHAFLCNDDPYWVVLDLTHDRYICIQAERFASMTPLLAGWSENSRAGAEIDGEKHCKELLSHGILTQEALDSKPARPESIPIPTSSLLEPTAGRRARLSPRALLSFALATAKAHRLLKRHPLAEIVHQVRARKPTYAIRRDEGDRVYAVVRQFELLRPYFPRAYLCLFDSLALLELLALEGIHPRWVFGVRAEPFAAHCWLQMGNVVINDSMDRIVEYNPIMAT